MKDPLVTIGLPVYNGGRAVLDAVKSVFCQTYENWELLIIDDGSTDHALDQLAEIADPRLRIIRDDQNRGLAYRLNQIALKARGVYLARMDADDLSHPDRIRRQVSYLLDNPQVDVVGSSMYIVDNEDQVVGVRHGPDIGTSVRSVLQRGLLLHATVMASTRWFLENPYDVSLRRAQDRDLWCRTVETSNFANLQEPLYFCREAGAVSPREYLRKYIANRNTRLLLLRRYGRQQMSLMERVTDVARTVAKTEVYRLLAYLGLHAALIVRSGAHLPESERSQAQAVLGRIRAYSLLAGV